MTEAQIVSPYIWVGTISNGLPGKVARLDRRKITHSRVATIQPR